MSFSEASTIMSLHLQVSVAMPVPHTTGALVLRGASSATVT